MPEPAPTAAQANGAIYQAGHDVALFENAVARRVGDTLTIRLNERTNASKSSTTSTSKSTNIELPGPTIAGRPVTAHGTEILSASVNNSSEFDGEGASTQSNRLEGDLTVTVAQRLPNGNLLVRGQKWISINQGQEYVRIQGIVRPIDIEVGQLDLLAEGRGRNDRVRRQGRNREREFAGPAGAVLQPAVPALLSKQ